MFDHFLLRLVPDRIAYRDMYESGKAGTNAMGTISEKLKRLLVIAGQVQRGGKNVTEDTVEAARKEAALLVQKDPELQNHPLLASAARRATEDVHQE